MIANITLENKTITVDLNKPIDVSMPLSSHEDSTSAWYVPPIKIEPVKTDQFVGDVNLGGSVNFNNIAFNPHGNGTHTECVGHISKNHESINDVLKTFFFDARLISIDPVEVNGDKVISLEQVRRVLKDKCQAVLIRTLPNGPEKMTKQYSNTNPPYIEHDVIPYLLSLGVDHILIDLPSVDREEDDGVLASHHAFWNYPENPNLERTITEFIYVPEEIGDGHYLLNLQIAPFENDASPSKPVLYKIMDAS